MKGRSPGPQRHAVPGAWKNERGFRGRCRGTLFWVRPAARFPAGETKGDSPFLTHLFRAGRLRDAEAEFRIPQGFSTFSRKETMT